MPHVIQDCVAAAGAAVPRQRLAGRCLPLLLLVAGCATADTRRTAPLAGTEWRLVAIQSMDDAQGTTRVSDPTRYTIMFEPGGTARVRLDCNRGFGPWQAAASGPASGSLAIGPVASSMMLCPEPSLGERVAQQLGYVRSYVMREGRLNMALMADGGLLIWERQ